MAFANLAENNHNLDIVCEKGGIQALEGGEGDTSPRKPPGKIHTRSEPPRVLLHTCLRRMEC